jgi:hypothetical protein
MLMSLAWGARGGLSSQMQTRKQKAWHLAMPGFGLFSMVGTAGFDLATPCTPFRSQAVFGRPLLSPLK